MNILLFTNLIKAFELQKKAIRKYCWIIAFTLHSSAVIQFSQKPKLGFYKSYRKSEICLRKLFEIVTHLYKHFTPQNFNKMAKNEKMSLKSACCQKNNPAVFHYLEWFFGVVYLRRLVMIFIYYNFYFNHFLIRSLKKPKLSNLSKWVVFWPWMTSLLQRRVTHYGYIQFWKLQVEL